MFSHFPFTMEKSSPFFFETKNDQSSIVFDIFLSRGRSKTNILLFLFVGSSSECDDDNDMPPIEWSKLGLFTLLFNVYPTCNTTYTHSENACIYRTISHITIALVDFPLINILDPTLCA